MLDRSRLTRLNLSDSRLGTRDNDNFIKKNQNKLEKSIPNKFNIK